MKGPALQNKQVGVLRMAFRARKVVGTLEKEAPGVMYYKCILTGVAPQDQFGCTEEVAVGD